MHINKICIWKIKYVSNVLISNVQSKGALNNFILVNVFLKKKLQTEIFYKMDMFPWLYYGYFDNFR